MTVFVTNPLALPKSARNHQNAPRAKFCCTQKKADSYLQSKHVTLVVKVKCNLVCVLYLKLFWRLFLLCSDAFLSKGCSTIYKSPSFQFLHFNILSLTSREDQHSESLIFFFYTQLALD